MNHDDRGLGATVQTGQCAVLGSIIRIFLSLLEFGDVRKDTDAMLDGPGFIVNRGDT